MSIFRVGSNRGIDRDISQLVIARTRKQKPSSTHGEKALLQTSPDHHLRQVGGEHRLSHSGRGQIRARSLCGLHDQIHVLAHQPQRTSKRRRYRRREEGWTCDSFAMVFGDPRPLATTCSRALACSTLRFRGAELRGGRRRIPKNAA
jgi:hypothetical protein